MVVDDRDYASLLFQYQGGYDDPSFVIPFQDFEVVSDLQLAIFARKVKFFSLELRMLQALFQGVAFLAVRVGEEEIFH